MAIAHTSVLRPATLQSRWTGPYATLPGSTKNIGTPVDMPVRRRVYLHHQPTGFLVREVWSAALTGVVPAFEFIPAGKYFTIAFDHTGQYNGETVTDIQVGPAA